MGRARVVVAALRLPFKNFEDAVLHEAAAHNPRGKVAFVIELGAAGHFSLYTSDAALMKAGLIFSCTWGRSSGNIHSSLSFPIQSSLTAGISIRTLKALLQPS